MGAGLFQRSLEKEGALYVRFWPWIQPITDIGRSRFGVFLESREDQFPNRNGNLLGCILHPVSPRLDSRPLWP